MTQTYHVKTPVSIALWEGGGEVEIDAVISYTVTPATSPSYTDPGSPAEVEIKKFSLSSLGHVSAPCPDWLLTRLESDDSFHGWLLSEAEYQQQEAVENATDDARNERALA